MVGVANCTHIEVVLGVEVETGERGVGLGGVDGGAAAVVEATVAILNLEGGVAGAGCPADVDVVQVDGSGDGEGGLVKLTRAQFSLVQSVPQTART